MHNRHTNRQLVKVHEKVKKKSDMWPSMFTHTWNLCSAFNHPTHTRTHTHTRSSRQSFMLRHPGSSWGFGALLKGTSVVVFKVEESTVHSLLQSTIPAGPET